MRHATKLLVLLFTLRCYAQRNTGVSPTAIALPTGPGSIVGLGSDFQPDLNTGTAVYSVPLQTVKSRVENLPALTLNYNGGYGNGIFGIGWRLSLPEIRRRTSFGLPTYSDTDQFSTERDERLIAVSKSEATTTYRKEVESGFERFRLLRKTNTWVEDLPDGSKLYFGEKIDGSTEPDQVREGTKVFSWLPSRAIDREGNEALFLYSRLENSANQVYLSEIRYNIGRDVYAYVRFSYSQRDDAIDDYKSGFQIRTSYRCTAITMGTDSGRVRSYHFIYKPSASVSLLSAVQLFGSDNATSLPALSFKYTEFTTGTVSVADLPLSADSAIMSGAAELDDLNGDGLPDILETSQGQHFWYKNLGRGHWAQRALLAAGNPLQLTNPAVSLADMDGDLRADLVIKEGSPANPMRYFRLMPSGNWSTTPILFAPNSISVNLDDPNVRFIDLNNDRRMDIMFTGDDHTWDYWINLGVDDSGFQQWHHLTGSPPIPARFASGLQLADMNGDGLLDLVNVGPSGITYWPNEGNGQWGAQVTMLHPPGLRDTYRDIKLIDANGDGTSDVVLIESHRVRVWPNLSGGSFGQEITIPNTPLVDPHTVLRVADLDGNGTIDILWMNDNLSPGSKARYLRLSAARPNLLASIDNGFGQSTELTYTTSIEMAVSDAVAGQPWTDYAPLPIPVVSQITVRDGIGPESTRALHYRDAYYGLDERRFAGFASVQELDPGDDSSELLLHHFTFNVGKDSKWRRGALEDEEFRDGKDQLLKRIDRTWEERELDRGINNERLAALFLSSEDDLRYEGGGVPAEIQHKWEHDHYGNISIETDYNRLYTGLRAQDTTPRGLVFRSDYTQLVDDDNWIVSWKIHEQRSDLTGKRLSESRFLYDGLPFGKILHGNLTTRLDWLDTRDVFIPRLQQAYDSYGNVIRVTNARGDVRERGYDEAFHIAVTSETIHLSGYDIAFHVTMDKGFNHITSSTGYQVVGKPPGQSTLFRYDVFGRLIAVIKPGDTLQLPTTEISYSLANPISYTETDQRITSGLTDVRRTRVFVDGNSRTVASKVEIADGVWNLREATEYNVRGLPKNEWMPAIVDNGAWQYPNPNLPHIERQFDSLARQIEMREPDGSFITSWFGPLVRSDTLENGNAGNTGHTRPFGHYRTYAFDERGHIVKTSELVGNASYSTVYDYSIDGHLTGITDPNGNSRRFTYDSLGRESGSDQPDSGHRSFSYDDADNLTDVEAAGGIHQQYSYDSAARIVGESGWVGANEKPKSTVQYFYDAPSSLIVPSKYTQFIRPENSAGRLSWVSDGAGEEHLYYDSRGNEVLKCKKLHKSGSNSLSSYWVQESFDASDYLIARTFPDGEMFTYGYNKQGLQTSVENASTGTTLIKDVEYAASGQPRRVEYGNGTMEESKFDSRNRQTALSLSTATGSSLLDYHYEYDPSSNVTAIVDGRTLPVASLKRNSQAFSYDDLNRLTEYRLLGTTESSPRALVQYKYDSIDNLIFKSSPAGGYPGHVGDPSVDLGKLAYGGALGSSNRGVRMLSNPAGPHAVTATDSGNSYDYGPDGSLSRANKMTLERNEFGEISRITTNDSIARYWYDYKGRRVAKEVQSRGTTSRTEYPFEFFDVRDSGAAVKWVLLGSRRVAAVTRSLPLVATPPIEQSIASLHGGDDEVVMFSHTDYLASVLMLTDSTGAVLSETSYFPDGVPRYQVPPTRAGPVYAFTGKEKDDESGFYYYGARYYDPVIGQFDKEDPLYTDIVSVERESPDKFDQNWAEDSLANPRRNNPYAYAMRNPLRYGDPSGNDAVDELQLTLAGVGFIPGPIGQIANLTNAGISVYRGDYIAASLSALAAIPVAGAAASLQITERLALSEAREAALPLLKAAEETSTTGLPSNVARVIPADIPAVTLAPGTSIDAFVTDASAIRGMTSSELSRALTIPESPSGFNVFEFPTPEGIASPINRTNPGFVGGGVTAGGLPEYVIPNGPIPANASKIYIP